MVKVYERWTLPKCPPQHTLNLAQRLEARGGRPWYAVRVGGLFVLQRRMPLIGEWWSSDGIRHG